MSLAEPRYWRVLACGVALLAVGCGTRAVPTPLIDAGGTRDGRGDAPMVLDGPGGGDGGVPAGDASEGDAFVRPPVGTCSTTPAVKKQMGDSCSCTEECGSGFCIDGVCCSSACSGICLACNVPGMMGTCSPVPDGLAPVVPSQCPHEAAGTCGHDGMCNGAGGCRRYPDGTLCAAGTCAGSTVVGAKLCSDGSCTASSLITCFPYACDATNSRCFDHCSANAQCDGEACQNGTCGKKAVGATCTLGADCDSGSCADGVCCNVDCSGACLACNQVGHVGTCLPVPSGHDDVHGVCKREAAATCGSSGVCNGQGGCSRYALGTICKDGSCSGASYTPPSTCDGQGTCVAGSAISCAPFLCADAKCQGTCNTNNDCVAPNSCQGGSCGKKGPGQSCKAATECDSNFCVDGVCCDSACNGKCVYCALPSALGRCVNVPPDVADPRVAAGETNAALICTDQGATSCGTNGRCDGQGGCQAYANGTVCQGESCDVSANRYGIGTCRNGTCSVSTRSCSPNMCNGNSCGASCSSDAQCALPNVCVKGSCGKKPNGEPCSPTNPTDCASGICAQGVCCASACGGSCQSCALPQSAGVCTPVSNGAPDPAGTCQDQKAAVCKTDGLCDGRAACRLYATGTVCLNASCAAGVAKQVSRCDGAGSCLPGTTAACTPIVVCNAQATGCEKTCTIDAQCATGTKCFQGKCGLLANGNACGVASDCKSGFCVDGMCCDKACGGNNQNDCQACSREAGAAKDGTCGARTLGAKCSDGNACTQNDVCAGLACVGLATTCTASDQCHAAGVCDQTSGKCSNPIKTNGAVCNDGSKCTRTDTCQNGACVGGNPLVCTGGGGCLMMARCDPGTGTCTTPAQPNGTVCNDGLACTLTDTCQNGRCVGSNPVVCPADDCHAAGTCNTANGTCIRPNKPDGTVCEDGNKCTLTDKCMAGVCTAGPPKSCATGGACQNDSTCDPTDGQCKGGTAKADGTLCNDNNLCTAVDTCAGGLCVGGSPMSCGVDATTCRKNSACNPLTGVCEPGAAQNGGASCPEGDKCLNGNTCKSDGTCGGGTPVTCPPGSQCLTAGACNPATGLCTAATPKTGTACDDGNGCTDADTCASSGQCVGTTKTCAPASACRAAESCDQSSGTCSAGTLLDGASCNDGNPCTIGDSCSSGTCSGTLKSCAPVDACHAPLCDMATGNCVAGAPVANNTSCTSSDLCATAAVCLAGVCTATAFMNCDVPPDACTVDTCVAGICMHAQVPCDDNDACTVDGCSGGTCTHTQMTCDDGDSCTNDTCAGGVCAHMQNGTCVDAGTD